MITAHLENVAIIVSITFQPSYQASTIPRVGHYRILTHLICVRLTKWVTKVKIKIWKILVHFTYNFNMKSLL